MNRKQVTKKKAQKQAKPAANVVAATKAMEVPSNADEARACILQLADESQPVEVRLGAMQAVQAATFSMADFDEVRAEYTAALRTASRGKDAALRQRALGILSRDGDAPTQKALVDGLRNAEKALVPTDKALQLLTYNPHAGALDAAEQLLRESKSESEKREAVRLLSTDPKSVALLEKTLGNKREALSVRRMSAAALHALQPDRLQKYAAKAVVDETENQDLVATCLTAMAQFGDRDAIARNKNLGEGLKRLETTGGAKVKKAAKQVRQKFGM